MIWHNKSISRLRADAGSQEGKTKTAFFPLPFAPCPSPFVAAYFSGSLK
jgi:hypothetical protein